MLLGEPKKVITLFSLVYKPVIGFSRRLSEAAEEVQRALTASNWNVKNNEVSLRDPDRGFLLVLRHNQMFCQTLGLDRWRENFEPILGAIRVALDRLGIAELAQVSHQFQAWLDLEMTHAELVDVCFGSYYTTRDSFAGLYDELTDLGVRLDGRVGEDSFTMQLLPQNLAHIQSGFFNIPNLALFEVERPKFSNNVKEFFDRIARDSLYVDLNVSMDTCPVERLSAVARHQIDASHELIRRSVNRILGVPAGRPR